MAVPGLLSGEVDMAVAYEFVLIRHILKGEDLRVLAEVAATDDVELIMRKESGVKNPPDLRGKKIGTVRGALGNQRSYRDLCLIPQGLTDVAFGNSCRTIEQHMLLFFDKAAVSKISNQWID